MRSENEMRWTSRRIVSSRRGEHHPSSEDQKDDVKERVETGDQIHDIAERELQKHLQDIGHEADPDPDGPDWEDLDAGDADDPMMVSEYVKVVEVRFSGFPSTPIH